MPSLDAVERQGAPREEITQRLGSALVRMARDLAAARRQIVVLRRENEALRTELAQCRGEQVRPARRSAAGRAGGRSV